MHANQVPQCLALTSEGRGLGNTVLSLNRPDVYVMLVCTIKGETNCHDTARGIRVRACVKFSLGRKFVYVRHLPSSV